MPFLDIFRNLFGIRNNQEDHPNFVPEIPRQENDSFRNPIWETEDDDDDYNSDFRQPNGGGIHFLLFRDPFEMSRHFESQMDGFLKSIMDGLTGQRGFFMLPFNDESSLESAIPVLPESPEQPEKSLRDSVLEREFDNSQNYSHELPKADSDLDGRYGTSFTTNIPRGDWTVEKRITFEDINGNKKTVITRKMGDQMHEIITKRDKEGIETKTENWINIDKNELNTFDSKWNSRNDQNLQVENIQNFLWQEFKQNPWHKFFGPEPKL